jgi:hypothetical protein
VCIRAYVSLRPVFCARSAKLLADARCDLRRQCEHRLRLAVIALGPDVCVVGRPDQLHRHVYLVARSRNRAFQDAVSFSGSFVIAKYDIDGNSIVNIKGKIVGTRVNLKTTVQDIL